MLIILSLWELLILTLDLVFALCNSRRKSPWSRRKRKWALTPHQWRSLFTPEGKLRDGGVGFLKKVRSRVSFFNKDHMYVLILTCLFIGSDLCCYGSVGC